MRHKFLVYRLRYRRNGSGQRGVALFVVIIFMTLSVLLALWASRSALFGEMVVGNDADYQRAFEAAQALLQDAELDIRGENADGTKCTPDGNDEKICRENNVPDQIPLEAKEVGSLFATLSELPIKCPANPKRHQQPRLVAHCVACGSAQPAQQQKQPHGLRFQLCPSVQQTRL